MSQEKDILCSLCSKALEEKGLNIAAYQQRLQQELKQIDNQDEYEYFLGLVRNKARFPNNENNLLVPYLLDLCEECNIEEPPPFFYGEFPDIDCDFLPEVQQYLKNDWAKKVFGQKNVCSIGNYATFGIKSALTDMARIHDKDLKEIKEITTSLEDKDDEGRLLSFDKALELYPALKTYCEANPEVASSARRLIGRNRGMGKHAGGLIISRIPIDDLVPLVRGENDTGDNYVSAFVEGLHGTDLGPLGLIKFDVLVVKDLLRIAYACSLVKERHNLSAVCSKDGIDNWTDLAYLNDAKCLEEANKGNLKSIFQFDSEGIRRMTRDGGVTSFDDLVAYSALYRPGPLGMKMEQTYIRRKRGQEEYDLHPLLQPILGTTYGVMVFQEQVMKILNIVGGISLPFCEKVRKAISKKKIKDFANHKLVFIVNGQKRLGWTEEQVIDLWSQIESFAEYGFNKSHSVAYAYISARLLWLKTYYPLEYFTATLRVEEDPDKINEYKIEGTRCGVKLNRVDVNKSKYDFNIVDDAIYMGFLKIKGIGETAAQSIVNSQPYANFEDFLTRYGTEAKVVKSLIALSVFPEKDRLKLYQFYEYYKDILKKREDRNKRNLKSREMIVGEMRYLMPRRLEAHTEALLQKSLTWQDELLDKTLQKLVPEIDIKQGVSVIKKYKKNIDLINKKNAEDGAMSYATFVPNVKFNEETKAGLIKKTKYDEMFKILTGKPQLAEEKYYGFAWDSILEHSPDFDGGMALDRFDDQTKLTLCVECQVVAPLETKVSKKGNNYYRMKVQDANGRTAMVNIWEEDYIRFKDEFEYWNDEEKRGSLFKIRLERPSGGFPTYTFDSPPKHLRSRQIPEDKAKDYRLTVMREPITEVFESSERSQTILID